MEDHHLKKQSDWLKNLQDNSYFPELILSGTLIAILFSLDTHIDNFVFNVKDYFSFPGMSIFIVIIFPLFYSTLLGLKATLVLHFVSRMIWTAFIGLSYAFPNDINKDKFKFDSIFSRNLNNDSSYERRITNLGKFAGVMFALILFIVLFMMGLVLLLLFPIVLMWIVVSFLGENVELLGVFLILIYLVSIILYVFDFLSGNRIRASRIGKYLIIPGHFIVYYIGLSFLYRRIYYTITTNFGNKLLIVFMICFTLGGYLYSYPVILKIMHWPNIFEVRNNRFNIDNSEYRDRIDPSENFQSFASIQSFYVNESINVFIRYSKGMDMDLEDLGINKRLNQINYSKFKEIENALKEDSIYNSVLNENIRVYIDGKYQGKMDWIMEYQPETSILGISTNLNIDSITDGKHYLHIARPKSFGSDKQDDNGDGFSNFSYILFKKVRN